MKKLKEKRISISTAIKNAIKNSKHELTSQEIADKVKMSLNDVRFMLKGLRMMKEVDRIPHWYASNRGSIRTWVYILRKKP